MSIVQEYKAILYEDDQVIDETCIDENNINFAWQLFREEFGHTKLNDTAYVTLEPCGTYNTKE